MATPVQHRPASAERWLARLALLALLVAAVLPLAAAGWRGLLLPFVIAGHLALVVIGAWLALAHRGAVRLVGVVLAVGAVVSIAVLTIRANLLWVVIVCAVLLVLSAVAGRAALRRGMPAPYRAVELAVEPPSRPFLIMNPRSGGGKVVRFGLREKAESLGAEVAVLEGPGTVDVAELARDAVARGADLLGVAGGDGTQALVAAVAAEHDVPLLVISAGTRNHFALDLGLDREDPSTCLDALRDGVEMRVDLGEVNGRPFVNNVSFGAYAAIVERPEYRDEKLKTTLDLLPDLLTSTTGPRLVARAGHGHAARPAGAAGQQQPLQHRRRRRARPTTPHRRRRARRDRRAGGQRRGGRPDAPRPQGRRPHPDRRRRGRGRRGRRGGPGRGGRRERAADHPGAVPGAAGGTAGARAPGPAWGAAADADPAAVGRARAGRTGPARRAGPRGRSGGGLTGGGRGRRHPGSGRLAPPGARSCC